METWTHLFSGFKIHLAELADIVGNLLLFILILGVLVFVHELGHFLAAKLNGVRVKEFALGFGPALIKKKKGETIYSLRIVPLGGFNKLAGMEPPEYSDPEEVPDPTETDEKAFYRKSTVRKMSILFAGPLMNIVLAIGLSTLIYLFLPVVLMGILPNSPAEIGGLAVNDRIVSINGIEVNTTEDVVSAIQGSAARTLEFVVDRAGEKKTLFITPQPDPQTGIPLIGIEMTGGRQSFGNSLRIAVHHTWYTVKQLVGELIKIIRGMVKPDFAGPIGLYQITGEVAQGGIWRLISFTVLLSINLAVLNLIPIPMLDGGGLLILLIEGIRKKPLSNQSKSIAQLVGLGLMITLLVLATMQDIGRISNQLSG
jgi:regulator of sigma E protease